MTDQPVIYKSSIPVAYLVWLVLIPVLLYMLVVNTFLVQAITLFCIFSVLIYLFLCKSTGVFILYEKKIVINYFFPLNSKKTIHLKEKTIVEYELGYYYYLSNEHRLGPLQWLYPCDMIFLYQENGKGGKDLYDSFAIYTTYKSFKILRDYLDSANFQS